MYRKICLKALGIVWVVSTIRERHIHDSAYVGGIGQQYNSHASRQSIPNSTMRLREGENVFDFLADNGTEAPPGTLKQWSGSRIIL